MDQYHKFLAVFVVLLFFQETRGGWYWGNHCGRDARNPYAPITDAFDAACYQHDRCQASGTADWLCSVQVFSGMAQASSMTGRPIPWQILSGFAAEHGKRKRRNINQQGIWPYFD